MCITTQAQRSFVETERVSITLLNISEEETADVCYSNSRLPFLPSDVCSQLRDTRKERGEKKELTPFLGLGNSKRKAATHILDTHSIDKCNCKKIVKEVEQVL